MSTAIEKRNPDAVMLETVLLGGDLSKLTAEQRMSYYKQVCESVGLNPLTRPFEYIQLNGKLTLYARRECTEQLRAIRGISIGKLEKTFDTEGGIYVVEAPATDKAGRTDVSTGAVNIAGLKGEAKANAIMKAETKAKRRVTLSICGLGMLDETEVSTIPGAVVVEPDKPKKISAKAEKAEKNAETIVEEDDVFPSDDEGKPEPPTEEEKPKPDPVDEFVAKAETASNYVDLLEIANLYRNTAARAGLSEKFDMEKRKQFGRLMTARGDEEPLIDVPNTIPLPLYLEFYALDEVARKAKPTAVKAALAPIFLPCKDAMRSAGVETEWTVYANALIKEIREKGKG